MRFKVGFFFLEKWLFLVCIAVVPWFFRQKSYFGILLLLIFYFGIFET